MAEKDKKYYWLKLNKDFFKSQEAKLLEGFGTDHLLFYMKMLCESIEHDGELLFSEGVPYTPDMLAMTTGTEKRVAENTIQLLRELKMVEDREDGTIVMKTLKDMVGHETYWAKKKREQKEREEKVKEEKAKEEKKKEEKTKPKTKKFVKPTVEQVEAYCKERNNDVDAVRFFDYYESKGWKVGKGASMKDWKASVRLWERNFFESDKRPATKFNNETVRDYDMDELEKMLLSSN